MRPSSRWLTDYETAAWNPIVRLALLTLPFDAGYMSIFQKVSLYMRQVFSPGNRTPAAPAKAAPPPIGPPDVAVTADDPNLVELRRRLNAKPMHEWTNDEYIFMLTEGLTGELVGWTPDRKPRRPGRPRPPLPRVSEEVHRALYRLRREEVWTVPEAETHLGPLRPLVAANEIRIISTGVGPSVILGVQGQRRVGMSPRAQLLPSPMTDLLYLRLAAGAQGWKIIRMPSRRHGSLIGILDRLALAERDGQRIRVLARFTDGGYARSTVLERFKFVRSALMDKRMPLIVVTPDEKRLSSLRGLDEYLEIVVHVIPTVRRVGA